MIVLSLFDGISCGLQSLKNLGIKVDFYYASEIDKHAIKVSKNNHPEIIHIGDVSKVNFKNGILSTENGNFNVGKIDLVLAGSPCQGFSFAGKQLNFNDSRSKLYFEFKRILMETKPTDFLLENVQMKSEFEDVINSDLNTWPIKINSKTFTPQNRLRYYWTSLTVPKIYGEFDLTDKICDKVLLDILEDKDCVGVYTIPRGYNKGGIKQSTKMPCITTSSWQHNFFVVKSDGSMRKFTPIECERAQGLPDSYTQGLSDNQRYITLGNCWTVPVIEHLLKPLKLYDNSPMEVCCV